MSLGRLFGKKETIEDGVKLCRSLSGAVLIDVRTHEEYVRGHIPGSRNFPLDGLQEMRLDKKTPVFVYCQSGARSRMACLALKQAGYEVTDIGGISGYKGELETGDRGGEKE